MAGLVISGRGLAVNNRGFVLDAGGAPCCCGGTSSPCCDTFDVRGCRMVECCSCGDEWVSIINERYANTRDFSVYPFAPIGYERWRYRAVLKHTMKQDASTGMCYVETVCVAAYYLYEITAGWIDGVNPPQDGYIEFDSCDDFDTQFDACYAVKVSGGCYPPTTESSYDDWGRLMSTFTQSQYVRCGYLQIDMAYEWWDRRPSDGALQAHGLETLRHDETMVVLKRCASGCGDGTTNPCSDFLNAFNAGDDAADYNGDGFVNGDDLDAFLRDHPECADGFGTGDGGDGDDDAGGVGDGGGDTGDGSDSGASRAARRRVNDARDARAVRAGVSAAKVRGVVLGRREPVGVRLRAHPRGKPMRASRELRAIKSTGQLL